MWPAHALVLAVLSDVCRYPSCWACQDCHRREALLSSIPLSMLPCWPAGVAFALNHFGPLCRAEGEEDQPLDLGDVQVCWAALVWLSAQEACSLWSCCFAPMRPAGCTWCAAVHQVMPAVRFCSCTTWPAKASCSHAGALARSQVVLCCRHSLSSWCCKKLKRLARLFPLDGIICSSISCLSL